MTQLGTEGSAKLRRAVERPSRRSAVRAVGFLAVAVTAGLGAATLVRRYLDRELSGAGVATETVAVAKIDLPLGTAITEEMVETVDWPSASLPEGRVSPAGLVGRVVVAKVFKGEPLIENKLASVDAGSGLAAVLPPGMLAVAVRVDDVVGVAGFVHPGDRVDVVVTMRPRETTDSPPISKIILQNIRVLAVGKQLDQKEEDARRAITATVATLMVSPDESERLALAANKGKILLALRSSLDTAIAQTPGIDPMELLGEPIPQKRSAPAAARRSAARPEPGPVVEILRNNLFEQRRFQEGGSP